MVSRASKASTALGSQPVDACRLLQYSFEPDCFDRPAEGTCRFDAAHPDFGPQISVWVESADGVSFVDTVLVTNAVALYGIGNRPGSWDFRSGPRYPYGRRIMALPVWAHRRGVLYDSVVMGDGLDDYIAAHMAVSSPEPYFCRPMLPSEVVDAVTCASGAFRSAKGVFDPSMPKSYFPPRGDLLNWGNPCQTIVSIAGDSCFYGDARQFAVINDLDVVAAATPAYDRTFTATWNIPSALAPGDYALLIEVGKELDQNDAFSHPSFLNAYEQKYYADYGTEGNVGQPSVVYRIPFHLSEAPIPATAITGAWRYGDWTGDTGDVFPVGPEINFTPGSGQGRLRVGDGPGGMGQVHLTEIPCAQLDCAQIPAPEAPRVIDPTAVQEATAATFTFRQASDHGAPVITYDLRFTAAPATYPFEVDEGSFEQWTAAPTPPVSPPDSLAKVTIDGLTPRTSYTIALRARGACGWSAPSFIRVSTGEVKYAKLSGCVIATAAYGSDLDPDVSLLRRDRDWLVSRSSGARLAALLYADSAPPLAQLIGRSEIARALVRSVLRPLVSLNRELLPGSN